MLVQIKCSNGPTETGLFIHKYFNHIALLQKNLETLKAIKRKKREPWKRAHLFLLIFDTF